MDGSSRTGETDSRNNNRNHHELSPLLLSQTSSACEDSPSPSQEGRRSSNNENGSQQHHDTASVNQTILNLMKTCMGTGCLALSYSCRQGGWLLFVVGAFAIASWNICCVQRLCFCLHYLPTVEDEEENNNEKNMADNATTIPTSSSDRIETPPQHRGPPPTGTSTLGRVAWYAYGRRGLVIMDIMMICLLIGVIVSYVAAAMSFLSDTPLSLGNFMNAVVVSAIMAGISLVPHMGYLSKASAVGLLVLFATILVIAGYGLTDLRREQEEELLSVVDETTATSTTSSLLPLWPESLAGISQWFGVVVFGYGVVPLTYNYRESMSEPYKMVGATTIALMAVSCLYVVIGVGLLLLFPDLTGDVLHELPMSGMLPVFTRLAMVWVILMTAPLLIVPCGELLEGRWQLTTKKQRILVRFGIMALCVTVACLVPGFVKVLSLVGSACVGTVSLILPPLLHLKLSTSTPRTTRAEAASADDNSHNSKAISQWTDKILLVVGITATVISTLLSL